MENDIVNGLQFLGYSGPINDVAKLESTILNVSQANSLVELSHLVHYLSCKLKEVCGNLEELVNVINNPQEIELFAMELAGLMRELHCPYSAFMEGPPSQRFSSRENRLKLLNFLVSECEAAVMIRVNKPPSDQEESSTARNLKALLVTLGIGKPPADVTTQQLFQKTGSKVTEILKKADVGQPLLNVELSEKQWWKLQEVHQEFVRDYAMRRETLLKRLDVTILSFTWSPTVKTKLDEVTAAYQPLRAELKTEPDIPISRLLSARQDQAYVDKTSNRSVRKTPLHRVIIGSVPDRGGRASEQRPPPPEMPKWQKRRPDQPRGGGGGGRGGRGGGRGGGGRVQGGWNQGDNSSWGQEQKPRWRGRGRN